MKCPKCQFENPEEMVFCGKCGDKLERICPECNFSNPPQFAFCGKCGRNLTLPSEPIPKDLSFDEKIDKIQRYLPKGLTEKILSQRDKIEGERKQVTVMFCDMEGFTSLSERLGPEEAYDTVDQIYELLIHKVHDYEGTVNEMTGDGIVALFGAPIALEDAPQRALRSAMAIHRGMSALSDRLRQERKQIPALKMRVGIHTGPVVVGTVGNNLRVEFKAVGDTVNLASRMEGLAEPGATYVTEDTFKLTEGFFRYEALGQKQVKGREKPVNVYRAIAPSTRRTRFDVSAERGLTPFVGRERELELLLDGFERAKAGRGQAFSVMAEAGVGKSRLLYEFRKAVSNEDVTFLEGKCLSYSRGVAYHPVIDILKSNFHIGESDTDSEVREKVKTGLKVIGADEATSLPYLLELLSVEDSGIDKIPLSPEARKDRIIEALNRNVLKGSEIRPVIMAVEDLHWIDKSSEERFKYLLDSISGARIFLIFTYRPEFVHEWGARSYHSQVTLNRLSNRESLAMVSHLLGTDDIDRDLEELILEKTEGVPFFIEEFVRSLLDLKIIEREDSKFRLSKDSQVVSIPSTIYDVIMARVDSLPEGSKEVLQTGSVIEREFGYELIKRVTGLQEQELLSRLSVLKDSELLYERGIYPLSTYIFKHALTREVVYDSILIKRKKELHNEIGNAVEDLYRENISEQYSVLAEHFIEAGNYGKGASYSKLAAKKAQKGASFNEAIEHAKKRLTSLERLPQTDDIQKQIIDARTVLGLYYNQIAYHIEAKECVNPIIDLARKHGHKRRLAQIYDIMGAYNHFVEENLSKAKKYLENALSISEEVGDIVSLFLSNYWLGLVLSENCEFRKANYHFTKALDINVATNTIWGISLSKNSISGRIYNPQGRINLGYQTSEEALRLAEESGDIVSKAGAYMSHGFSCYLKRRLKKAEELLLAGVRFSERINHFVYSGASHIYLGETYFEIGDYYKSSEHYERSASIFKESKISPSLLNSIRMGLVRANVMEDKKEIDLESLHTYVSENKIRFNEGWMQSCLGEILLNIDDQHLSEAGDWIKKAIEANKRNGMMWLLGRDHALYAELFKRKGDKSKAKENLTKAIDILKECGADGWVKKYEEEVASLA